MSGSRPTMDILWLLCSLALMGGVSRAQENNCSYHALLRHLNLEKKSAALAEVRPVKNFTKPTFVMVDMLLNGILEVNEKTQTFTCFVTVSTTWSTDFLQWDPKDVCGHKRISIKRDKLWIPDIVILEDISNSGVARYNQNALVFHHGATQVVDRYQLTTACKMDLYKFPFDSHVCYVTFQSVLNRVEELRLGSYFNQSAMNDFTREVFTSLGEWDFLRMNMSVEQFDIDPTVWDQLIYMITVKRRPLLYIINLVIPITFLMALDLASFFISEARGEKLGFKVTILLSISVLLLILQDIMPSTANQLPLMALYCIVIFILSGLSLLETMLVSFLIDLDSWVQKDMDTSKKTVFAETQEEVQKNCEAPGSQREPVKDTNTGLEMKENQLNNSDVDVHRKETQKELLTSDFKPRFYLEVAQKIDTVYFCVYFIIVVAFIVYIYNEWVH